MQISVTNIFFATLGVALLAWSYIAFSTEIRERPNVLVLMIDTVRADHVGAYGYERDTTPFLDSLFRRGAVFERAYAPAYLTFQADASVLTGLYPSQHNVRTWTTPVRSDVRLLPEIFKLYGYETHAFVWQSLRPHFGLDRGFDTYTVYREKDNLEASKDDVLAAIEARERPFFVYWTIYDVHVPMDNPLPNFAPEKYNGPFAMHAVFDWAGQSTSTIVTNTGDVRREFVKTLADREYVHAQYDSGIRRVDDELREVFARLGALGELDNTIVVISSEHGEDLGEHGFFFHRDVYENGIHVPLAIVYSPAVASRRIETPVTLLDLAPTLTDLAGLPRFEAGEGVSLVAALSGSPLPERTLFSERHPFGEYAAIAWPHKIIVRDELRDTIGLSNEAPNDFFRALRSNDVALTDEYYNLVADSQEQSVSGVAPADLLKETRVFKERMDAALHLNLVLPEAIPTTRLTYP